MTQKKKVIHSKAVSNKSYTADSATGLIRGNVERNSKENAYSTIQVDGAIGNQINEGTANQQVKPVNSAGYDLAKPQIKAKEESKEYDHLEHLGLNQRPDKGHDSSDTYEHADVEGKEINDAYSHAQSRQYFHTDSSTPAQNQQGDNTYEQAKCAGYSDGDAYDHTHVSARVVNEEFSDYAYAHAQNSTLEEGDYDHAGRDDRNDIDTNE